MTSRLLIGLVLLGLAAPAEAQSKRVFPDAQCSYTLADKDWVWLDPRAVGHPNPDSTIVLAQKLKASLVFAVRVERLGNERPGRRSYRDFESGLVRSGRIKVVGRRHLELWGVPGYEMDVESEAERRGPVRVLFANDRMYSFSLMTDRPEPPAAADVESAYRGFEFVGRPKPMLPASDGTDDDGDGALPGGLKLGAALGEMTPLWMVLLILFGAWVVIRIRG